MLRRGLGRESGDFDGGIERNKRKAFESEMERSETIDCDGGRQKRNFDRGMETNESIDCHGRMEMSESIDCDDVVER